MKLLLAALSCSLLLAACDSSLEPQADELDPPTNETLYLTDGTVIDEPKRGPVLCVGTILESLPPQCHQGHPLLNWDWEKVRGREVRGVTWGHYVLVGRWDGRRFEVVDFDPEPGVLRVEPISAPPSPGNEYTPSELRKIEQDATGVLKARFGADVLWSSRMEWYVELGVIVATQEMRDALADEYGEDVIRLVPGLRRVIE